MKNFWSQLAKPIFVLSPMDGVTDAPFRFISAKYGKPDVHFTEFTNVEGLARNAAVMLDDFIYDEIERPIVAQIYGSEPDSFYKIAVIACELGFDGIDINMGCPAKKVASRGCGAGLIRTPDLAKEIIRAVKRGVQDWAEGKSVTDLGLKPRMSNRIAAMNQKRQGEDFKADRCRIPVSVKTRLGYDAVTIEDWVKHLLEEEPVAISIHGRTLKQMYSGEADWEAIARAAEIIHQTPTLVLGNGDLTSVPQIFEKIRLSQVDGVLIGRAALGNPWIFREKENIRASLQNSAAEIPNAVIPELSTRFDVLLEHARTFEDIKGPPRFAAMRKHFSGYCRGMPKAAELRNKMFQTKSSQEVEQVLRDYVQDLALTV